MDNSCFYIRWTSKNKSEFEELMFYRQRVEVFFAQLFSNKLIFFYGYQNYAKTLFHGIATVKIDSFLNFDILVENLPNYERTWF